jgi:leucyl/phenylalanyl-tRNA--protein transferase
LKLPWLGNTDIFPPLEFALSEPNGLLCSGDDLTPQRLVPAYINSIFS